MGDNITIKDSSNAVVPVATEDIGGGVEVQRIKLMLGSHGQDGGDVTGPNPLPVEVQNTTDTDNPAWGNQGPLTQDAREQSNYDSVNPLLTRDTHLGRVLGQDLLVNPSTKRLQVEGAPVADNSVFGVPASAEHGFDRRSQRGDHASPSTHRHLGRYGVVRGQSRLPELVRRVWPASRCGDDDGCEHDGCRRLGLLRWRVPGIPRQIQCVHFRRREGDGRDFRQRQVCNHGDRERNGWRHGFHRTNHWL